jgi:signal peptidase I
MAHRPTPALRAFSYRLAQVARWPRPLLLTLLIVLVAVLAAVWAPLLFVAAALWAMVAGGAVLDARLRGRRGVLTGLLVLVGGPLMAAAIALVTRRQVRKVGRRFRSALPYAILVGALAGVLALYAGTWVLDRAAFTATAPSGAMAPRIRTGDRLLISPILHSTMTRGEQVALGPFPGAEALPAHGRVVAIGRVVGLAGEWVGATTDGLYTCDEAPDITRVIVANRHCAFPDESTYITTATPSFGPVEVPAGAMFVLGDHRDDLTDSRTYGPVPTEAIVGRIVATVWPPRRFAVR